MYRSDPGLLLACVASYEDGFVSLLIVEDNVCPQELRTNIVFYQLQHKHDHVRLNQCLMSTKQKLEGHNTDS